METEFEFTTTIPTSTRRFTVPESPRFSVPERSQATTPGPRRFAISRAGVCEPREIQVAPPTFAERLTALIGDDVEQRFKEVSAFFREVHLSQASTWNWSDREEVQRLHREATRIEATRIVAPDDDQTPGEALEAHIKRMQAARVFGSARMLDNGQVYLNYFRATYRSWDKSTLFGWLTNPPTMKRVLARANIEHQHWLADAQLVAEVPARMKLPPVAERVWGLFPGWLIPERQFLFGDLVRNRVIEQKGVVVKEVLVSVQRVKFDPAILLGEMVLHGWPKNYEQPRS